jgi:2'-5' RNA ligase
MRTFIAIEVPDDITTALVAMQNELRSIQADVRWEKRENIHLTLRFLGEIEEQGIVAIVNACQETATEFRPFTLSLNGSDVFPNARKPKVLWAGLGGEIETLSAMQEKLDEKLSAIGMDDDEKGFHPHITIGRVKSIRKVREVIVRAGLYDLPAVPFEVREITVFQSELLPTGSRYTPLVRVSLGAHAS